MNSVDTKKDAQSYVESHLLPTEPQDSASSHQKNSTTINIPKHQVIVHPKSFANQPQGYEMGKITNYIKRMYSEYVPVTKILEYFAKGHCIMLSDMQIDFENRFSFISSSIFAIDIDDVEKKTNPKEVIMMLKDKLVGLFYTFSHNKEGKGNRYRLLFQLDRVITDEKKLRSIISLVANDLKNQGLPVDTQAKNPLQIVRGGNKGYELVNANNKLNADDLLDRIKRDNYKKQQEQYSNFGKNHRPVSFKALKEMAECIGYIPSGTGETELWNRLTVGLKHYANSGYITQDEGFELFDIISGGEQSQRQWETKKANGQATIGSFIREARKRGYKGKYTYLANEDIEETYNKETIKVNRYIPTDVAKDILASKERVLVDSPTGSGKTTSFINAFKELQDNSKHFYIFSVPTITLTQQCANNHNLIAIKGQTKDLFKTIHTYIKNQNRVFVSTYDMVPVLIEMLQIMNEPLKISYTLVVDEMHKFVTDYDKEYRFDAVQKLNEAGKTARAFIGLSGTIDDIYKNDFDKVIHIDNGNPASPCTEFAVYTYKKKKEGLAELVKLIEIWSTKRKLLIFIQSKDKIMQIQDALRQKGITVRTVSADSKKNTTYKQLVENETIEEGVQVVLSTSVIADGVNIKNSMEWEVIAVCNDFSPLFNYSAMKQISNRLRNPYRRFSLFMQDAKEEEQNTFCIESSYKWRCDRANKLVDEINEHPYFDKRLFRSSEIEKKYGIYEGEEKLEVDTLFLRHAVSNDQEKYYSGCRYAFIKVVEKVLHKKAIGILDVTEEIKKQQIDLADIKEILDRLEAQAKKSDAEKEEGILQTFDTEVYQAFVEQNEEVINGFKKATIPRHFACISGLSRIADYETCKKIVSGVKRDADSHAFFTAIRSVTDANFFSKVDRPNATRTAFFKLLELDRFMTTQEYKKALERIAKQIKMPVKDIKVAEKLVIFENSREGKDRTRVKRVSSPITVGSIAEMYDIPISRIEEIMKTYTERFIKKEQRGVQTIANGFKRA
ncbi:hypothetical protein COF81_14670 [Bacillus pseudomycoides]|uniref:Helicase ATP-binding domain-containing protein n=1 Tax=Bacillus pseudomycoides TaxID=64104 RepID=A0ABD6T760_9BACI|nr:DEAD/DEAH box helicase family protein [Bacillus pseudomycoides]PHE95357.1 hypothetical protein COF81_14670 [Bacillus pseudomycoides]